MKFDNQVAFNFASAIWKDIQTYLAEHQQEYEEYLNSQEASETDENN